MMRLIWRVRGLEVEKNSVASREFLHLVMSLCEHHLRNMIAEAAF